MLRHFYSFALILAVPFMLLRLLLKSLSIRAYRENIGQRFGKISLDGLPKLAAKDSPTIWIHAVSVGETVAAAPLVKALLELTPRPVIVFTTTTPTGADRARSLFQDSVIHSYSPYDLGFVVRRFLSRVRPRLLIIMETELWPNMLHYCQQSGVRVLLANGRLSEKSAAGYAKIAGLTRRMLQQIDHIAVQADADAERFQALGAPLGKMSVTGSLKFHTEGSYNEQPLPGLFQSIKKAGRPVIMAASTREGEEEKVLSGIKPLLQRPSAPLLLLVPRHPERFDKVEQLCLDKGLKVQRRSRTDALSRDTQVLLGDSMGEMLAYYSLADIAFVGGSLVDTGCQNVLEPAALAIPVVVGPSQFNFATICKQLEAAGALKTVPDSDAFSQAIGDMLDCEETRLAMGRAGRAVVEQNQQALPLLVKRISSLLGGQVELPE